MSRTGQANCRLIQIREDRRIQLYGRNFCSKNIDYLLDESDFFQIYRARFYDDNLSQIKIEYTTSSKRSEDEKIVFWMSDHKGPVVSYFDRKKFSSKVIRLSSAYNDLIETHLEVISYLKSIRSKQTLTHITLNILEKLMIEHKKCKKIAFVSRIKNLPIDFTSFEHDNPDKRGPTPFKKPIILEALLNELNSIMENNLKVIEAVCPITDRRIAEVYLNRILFKKTGFENMDPEQDEKEKAEQWESLIVSTISNWDCGKPPKEQMNLTHINAFYDFLLQSESKAALNELYECIEKYAMSDSFGVLLNEFDQLEYSVENDWEFQLFKEYHNAGLQY